jgi:hypothetical protein
MFSNKKNGEILNDKRMITEEQTRNCFFFPLRTVSSEAGGGYTFNLMQMWAA